MSGWKAFVSADEVASLYRGHEVCSHTVNHPHVWSVPSDQLRWEMLEDRRRLEGLVGYPVRGFVLPYGWWTGYDTCMKIAGSCGFHYLRHATTLPEFELPADFLDWKPTCHCAEDLTRHWSVMVNRSRNICGQLFYLWGHSYEYEDDLGWNNIEEFAALAAGTPGVWHASKGNVYDYVTAWRRLSWNLEGTVAHNPSAIPVWCLHQGNAVRLEAGRLTWLES